MCYLVTAYDILLKAASPNAGVLIHKTWTRRNSKVLVFIVQSIVAHTILSTVRKNMLDGCCVGQTISHTAVHICFSGVAAINWAWSWLPCHTVACRNSSVTLLSCPQPQTVQRHAGIVRLTQCNIPQSGATPPKNQRETETTRRKALL